MDNMLYVILSVVLILGFIASIVLLWIAEQDPKNRW